jgi:glycosyltransferase involved in cell wall biosynthesis
MVEGGMRVAIVPALDEEDTIAETVRGLVPVVDRVLVVDNGSTDETSRVAREAGAEVVTEPRRGYGRACLAGMARAAALGASVVLFADGDGSDHPGDAARLLAALARDGGDLVLGVRTRALAEPGSMTPVQRFGNWLAPALIRVLLGADYHDMPPLKACRRDALDALGLTDTTYGFTIELLIKAHRARLRVSEIPVRCRRRLGGESKVSGTLRGSARAAGKILWTVAVHATARRP